MNKRILIIDDDIDLCTLLTRFLTRNGFDTETAYTGNKGLALFAEKKFDAVISDYRLGDMDGAKLVSALKKQSPKTPVLVITGYSDIKTAVEVIKAGAFDYITKPLIPDEVLNILGKMLTAEPSNDNSTVGEGQEETRKEREVTGAQEYYVGISPAALRLYEQVNIVSSTNYSIILYGESGTGKEVIARTIHDNSSRRGNAFVAMDCGTLSKELSGSELFGHVKGAFTGALQDKEGHFELANGGTLFLDEVGNLSAEVQATLLRVIQERKFKRVGGNKEMETDVRLIVASNENLQEAYRKGRFREDLYHRFNEFSINLPQLRARKEDILPLADFFLAKSENELNKKVKGFDRSVLDIFIQYGWPGNLREFRNVVRRAVLLTDPGAVITRESLPWEIVNDEPSTASEEKRTIPNFSAQTNGDYPKDILKDAASRAEFDTIMAVLQQVNFNKKKAAELLNIDRKTLYNKIKSFQLLNEQGPG